ncbi:MAG: substrate-binding domain-containing protein [Akkermansiaceae bacterium]
MAEWRRNSTAKQLSDFFREELGRQRWTGTMPGVIRLSNELGVSRNTVEAALRDLEQTGILKSQGKGRGRTIHLDSERSARRGIRVGILNYEASDRSAPDMLDLYAKLEENGHMVDIASKTLEDLGHRADRVACLVETMPVDAWIVLAGSLEVLEWFARSSFPTIAYAGRARNIEIASITPDKVTPLREAVRRLTDLGHQRIVMMVREDRRFPEPGFAERAFLEELENSGIATGSFNLPDWNQTIEGFHASLDSLFRFTPPTALITDEVPFAVATMQFCLARGLKIPEDLSLVCGDPGRAFDWCHPAIAHIEWNYRPVVRRMVRWVENVSQGKRDLRKSYSPASFVEGGTIGPVAG